MSEHPIIEQVYAAKEDPRAANELIKQNLAFIKAQASKHLKRHCMEDEDEFSIAMIAFHEAITHYHKGKGAFFPYAALTIRSRLIDYKRKEARHIGHISLQEEDEVSSLEEKLADPHDAYAESDGLAATKQEIAELSKVMERFGISFTDIADNTPKQDRTLDACSKVIRYAGEHKEILDMLLSGGKLPLSLLCEETGIPRKTLERHRKYLLAMLLIQTNGYEIIRGHLHRVLKKEE